MTSASDKARFYLEQTVPELREWERREIFSKSEITSIASQRSTFEHIVNSREASPSVYARYIAYETNLASLSRMRIKRKNLKSSVNERSSQHHTSQKRILNLLERATRKFHGDLALWMQYISFCRTQNSNKRTVRVMTEMLRLFPTKGEVWTYAAKWCWDRERRMSDVRGYFLRGLRFCGTVNKDLWVDFARQEMVFLGVLEGRRRILGLGAHAGIEELERKAEKEVEGHADAGEDMIALPTDDEIPQAKTVDTVFDDETLRSVLDTPAAQGAIPLSIYDKAMVQFSNSDKLAGQFFDMFAGFSYVPCGSTILRHVVDTTRLSHPQSIVVRKCVCKLQLVGHEVDSAGFPAALRLALKEIRTSLAATEDNVKRSKLAGELSSWLNGYLDNQKLGPELEAVIGSVVKQMQRDVIIN